MNTILFDVLLFVVILCSLAITGVVIPWIKNQIHESEYAELLDTVEKAIRKAEQKITGIKQGTARKAQVVAFLKDWLNRHSIEITEEQLDTLIEAAVWSMNNEE